MIINPTGADRPKSAVSSRSSCQRSSSKRPPNWGSHRIETLSLWPTVSQIGSPLSVRSLTFQCDGGTKEMGHKRTEPTKRRLGERPRAVEQGLVLEFPCWVSGAGAATPESRPARRKMIAHGPFGFAHGRFSTVGKRALESESPGGRHRIAPTLPTPSERPCPERSRGVGHPATKGLPHCGTQVWKVNWRPPQPGGRNHDSPAWSEAERWVRINLK